MECAQAKGVPTFLPLRRSSESFTSGIIPIMSPGNVRVTPSAATRSATEPWSRFAATSAPARKKPSSSSAKRASRNAGTAAGHFHGVQAAVRGTLRQTRPHAGLGDALRRNDGTHSRAPLLRLCEQVRRSRAEAGKGAGAHGIPLPQPDKPRDATTTGKITFDAMNRRC